MQFPRPAVSILALALAACTGDGPRDSDGAKMQLSEPKIISAIDATTNLPVMYNTGEIVIKRIIRDNGRMIQERYYHKGRLVAETEKIRGKGVYSVHSVSRLEREDRFRESHGLSSMTMVEPAGAYNTTGFYTTNGVNCDVSAIKPIGGATYRGRPNSVLFVYSCSGLHKMYRGYMKKVVGQFGAMNSSDQAVIASRIDD